MGSSPCSGINNWNFKKENLLKMRNSIYYNILNIWQYLRVISEKG